MAFEHFDVGEGQAVDFRLSLSHGQHKLVLRAVSRAQADPTYRPDVTDAYIQAFTIGWSVRDENGAAVEWPAHEPAQVAAIERVPAKIVDAIFTRAVELYSAWRKDADPNASSETSSGSPTA